MKQSVVAVLGCCLAVFTLAAPVGAQQRMPELVTEFPSDCTPLGVSALLPGNGSPAASPSLQDTGNYPGTRAVPSLLHSPACTSSAEASNWRVTGFADHVILGGAIGTGVGIVIGTIHARSNDTLIAPAIFLTDMLIGAVAGGVAGGVVYAVRILR